MDQNEQYLMIHKTGFQILIDTSETLIKLHFLLPTETEVDEDENLSSFSIKK